MKIKIIGECCGDESLATLALIVIFKIFSRENILLNLKYYKLFSNSIAFKQEFYNNRNMILIKNLSH